MKIKCVKTEKCPVCGYKGSIQVFFNKQGKIKYGRVRHYTGINEAKKPQFNYHKVEDLKQLETLLKSSSFKFPTSTTQLHTAITTGINPLGHIGQESMETQAQFGLKDLSSISEIKGAGSSARIEHHPPKVGVVGSNPTPPVTGAPWAVLETQVGYLWFLNVLQLL